MTAQAGGVVGANATPSGDSVQSAQAESAWTQSTLNVCAPGPHRKMRADTLVQGPAGLDVRHWLMPLAVPQIITDEKHHTGSAEYSQLQRGIFMFPTQRRNYRRRPAALIEFELVFELIDIAVNQTTREL